MAAEVEAAAAAAEEEEEDDDDDEEEEDDDDDEEEEEDNENGEDNKDDDDDGASEEIIRGVKRVGFVVGEEMFVSAEMFAGVEVFVEDVADEDDICVDNAASAKLVNDCSISVVVFSRAWTCASVIKSSGFGVDGAEESEVTSTTALSSSPTSAVAVLDGFLRLMVSVPGHLKAGGLGACSCVASRSISSIDCLFSWNCSRVRLPASVSENSCNRF